MTDKDNNTRPYHYEPYPTLTAKPNNTNSLKRNEIKSGSNTSSLIHNPNGKQSGGGNSKCCCCTISARSATFWASFLTNLGICTLLFGYTLLGETFYLYFDYYCFVANCTQVSQPNKHLLKLKLHFMRKFPKFTALVTVFKIIEQSILETNKQFNITFNKSIKYV